MQNSVTKGTDSKNRKIESVTVKVIFQFIIQESYLGKTLKLDKLLHLQSQVYSFFWGLIVRFFFSTSKDSNIA